MKKIGLLCLALVLALGTLGVGYAMWSDTITITGTVNTGSVDLDIMKCSNTWVWKLIPVEPGDPDIAIVHDWDSTYPGAIPANALDYDPTTPGKDPVAYGYAQNTSTPTA